MADGPKRRLRAVAGAELAQDRLQVNLHGRFRDIEAARDHLVRRAFRHALQDFIFTAGERGCSGRPRRRLGAGRIRLRRDAVRRPSVADTREHRGREHALALHDEGQGFQERVAAHRIEQVALRSRPDRAHEIGEIVALRQHHHPRQRLPLPERRDHGSRAGAALAGDQDAQERPSGILGEGFHVG